MSLKCATSLLVAVVAAHLLVGGVAASSLSSSVQPLYDATEGFLNVIQPADKSFLLRDVVPELIDGTFWPNVRGDAMPTVRSYMQSMLGYSMLLCFGIFLIIFVPLCGCCVCCCRCCCNKCGGKLNYMERKGAKCRWGVYGAFSLTFTTLILFGAVFALVSNQLLRQQLTPPAGQQRPGDPASPILDTFSSAVAKTLDILTMVPRNGRNATLQTVENVTGRLIPVLNRTMIRVQIELTNSTGALAALKDGGRAVDGVDAIKQLAKNCTDGHQAVLQSLNALNRTLSEARENLTVGPCPNGASAVDCDMVNRTLVRSAGLIVQPKSAELTDLTGRLDTRNLTEARVLMADAAAAMANISTAGMEKVLKSIEDVRGQVNGSQLMKMWDTLQVQLDGLANSTKFLTNSSSSSQISNPLTGSRDSLSNVLYSLDTYRYYTYIGLATFALLLAALFYLGLLFGCIGEPPYEDSSCCNRGVGANFMLAGAGLGFLFYALIMLIVIVLFLPGALMYTEGCRFLTNRPGSNGWSMLDGLTVKMLRGGGGMAVNLTRAIDQPVTLLLGGCSGGSLGSALDKDRLDKALGLSETVAKFLNETMENLANRSSDFTSGASLNLTQFSDLKQTIADVSNINFTAYQTGLSMASPTSGLTPLLNALASISVAATSPDDRARYAYHHAALRAALSATDAAIADQRARVDRVYPALTALTSLITDALNSMAVADKSLRSKTLLRDALDASSGNLLEEFLAAITSGMAGLLSALLDCPSLGGSLRQAIRVPCGDFLQPFNGFWAGMGICLMGLLPCLLLAIKLANIYRKTQKYLPDLDDGNPKPV